ncbi:MAG TPA: hypothetical protein VHB73_00145, partial [Alphaproteobacteria bacterium]|nr:hypothetical protein [Alphaproteobacteria bacterium]
MDTSAFNTKIQSILSAYYAKQAALKAPNFDKKQNPAEWDAKPPRDSQIRSFRQDSSDVLADTLQNARSVGDLTGGKTRLNVLSALT